MTMTTSVDDVRSFVSSAALPAPAQRHFSLAAAPTFNFDQVKEQAAVVGGQVISFQKGAFTEQQRQDVVNAALFAQLVAKKQHPLMETLAGVRAWYDVYFDALLKLGFAVQENGFVEYSSKESTFEAHEAIIEVISALLAGSPGALALAKTTLTALHNMDKDSPWITVFNRESHSAHAARFQISLASTDDKGDLMMSLFAFALEAKSTLTQVLFFRFHKESVTIRHNDAKITISPALMTSTRDALTKKIAAYADDFIRGTDL